MAMAAYSSSLCNFLASLLPAMSQLPKTPPPNLLSPPLFSTPFPSLSSSAKGRHGFGSISCGLGRDGGFYPSSFSSSSSSDFDSISGDFDALRVACPAVAYANTMFFKSAYNVQVVVDENEPEDRLLNRFRREVMRAGVIQECKRRRFFENKQEERKRKTREAAKRNRKRRSRTRPVSNKNAREASKVKKDDDEEDNWEYFVGEDLPN